MRFLPNKEDLVDDAEERNLQVAVEALIEECWRVSNSQNELENPEIMQGHWSSLEEGKVLSSKELKLFEEAVKLRNIPNS